MGGDSRQWLRRFLGGPAIFTLGAAASGMLVGIAVAWFGGLMPARAVRVAALTVAALLLLGPVVATSLRAPTGRWMVPRSWMRFGRARHSLLFGVALGTGFATRVTTGTVYLLGLCVAAAGDLVHAAGMFGVFGLARGVPLILVGRCLSERSRQPKNCLAWMGWSRPIPDLLGRITVSFLAGAMIQEWLLVSVEF